MFTNNTAVEFYPWFGARPPYGAAGELMGTVMGNDTNLPIEGALVTAESISMGDSFTYTTDITGTYSASLCPDFYEMTAEAPGYQPNEAYTPVYSGTQTIQDFALIPLAFLRLR